jgi:hypothetical protein
MLSELIGCQIICSTLAELPKILIDMQLSLLTRDGLGTACCHTSTRSSWSVVRSPRVANPLIRMSDGALRLITTIRPANTIQYITGAQESTPLVCLDFLNQLMDVSYKQPAT